MGAIGGLLGVGGGQSGTGVAGPQSANLMPVLGPSDLAAAGDTTHQNMAQQQQLLQALQQQNGLGNQSGVYNQLQQVASGAGPNPAQAQYQQNIQQLAAQQAGAIASAKGISPALQARMAATQGGAAMQNAAGQGAANLATQQLGALGAAGNIAGQQVGNQVGQTNANTQAAQANQQMYQNAAANFNSAMVGNQSSVNSANAGLANTQLQGQQGVIGSGLSALGVGAKSAAGARGGLVQMMAPGGFASAFQGTSGPQSQFGQFLASNGTVAPPQMSQPVFTPGVSSIAGGVGGNNKKSQGTPTPTQPGGLGIDAGGAPGTEIGAGMGEPAIADVGMMAAAKGGMTHDYRRGGGVQAKNASQKAVKSGNSYANDKIPAVLSEGEVVIPRNVMQSADPARGAMQFVQAILAKKRAGR